VPAGAVVAQLDQEWGDGVLVASDHSGPRRVEAGAELHAAEQWRTRGPALARLTMAEVDPFGLSRRSYTKGTAVALSNPLHGPSPGMSFQSPCTVGSGTVNHLTAVPATEAGPRTP